MRTRCAIFVLFSSLITHSAYADSIPVTAGSFSETTPSVANFTISGSTFSISGVGTSVDVLQRCVACTPDSAFNVSGSWDFEGVEDSGGINMPIAGRLTFTSGLVTIPDLPVNGSAVFRRLFKFTGDYAVPGALPVQIDGRGIVILRFSRLEGEGVAPNSIRYDFSENAAVPEPATMGLVGSGLIAAYLGRRRARKR